MDIYNRAHCELVATLWMHAYWDFIRLASKPHTELCMLSNPCMHFGPHRYIVDTSVLQF